MANAGETPPTGPRLDAPRATETQVDGDLRSALHRRAVFLVLFGACIMSLNGYMMRTVQEASAWQILFYRSLTVATVIFVLFVLSHRRRALNEFRRAMPNIIRAVPFMGLSSICFIHSLTFTTVAITTFTMSSIPFFAAILAWLFLKEPVTRATLIAIAAMIGGIGIMVADSLGDSSVIGILLALGASVVYASFVVSIRAGQRVDMLPAICIGMAITASISAVAAENLAVSMDDFFHLLIWGALVSSVGHGLHVFGLRYVRAAEVTLLSLAEFILAPFWVWLAINEVPGKFTFLGGAIMFAALFVWSVNRLRAGRATVAAKKIAPLS